MHFKLTLLIFVIAGLGFSGCTTKEIREHLLHKKEKCEVMLFNAPLTGFKTFYTKEINVLGFPERLQGRMTGFFGHSLNYNLKVTWINPLYAILSGSTYNMLHFNDEGQLIDEGERVSEAMIFWEAHFDPYSRRLLKIVDIGDTANRATRLDLQYHSEKLSIINNGHENFQVLYDEYGNILSMLDSLGEGVKYSYSDIGENKRMSFEPAGVYVSEVFTIAEMLNWVPTRPSRERTTATGIWGDTEPAGIVDYVEYRNHVYDDEGNLTGWNSVNFNGWRCNNSSK